MDEGVGRALRTDSNAKFSLGMREDLVGISTMDWAFLSHVIRALQPTVAVELGTSHGVTTLGLALMLRLQGGRVLTCDLRDLRPEAVRAAWPDNATFVAADLYAALVPEVIDALHAGGGRALLICDAGDKLQDLQLYAP